MRRLQSPSLAPALPAAPCGAGSAIRPGFGNLVAVRTAACLVLVAGNGLLLTAGPQVGYWGAPLSRFGLDLLLAVGGYAAAESWLRLPRPLVFLRRGARRLLPALGVFVLLMGWVAGPALSRLGLGEYARHPLTWAWMRNLILWPEFWLPGLFEGQQWAGTVNPLLWVPGLAALLRLALPLLGRLRPTGGAAVLAVVAAAAMAAHARLAAGPITTELADRLAQISLALPFLCLGAGLRLLQQRWPRLLRADVAMLLFGAAWVAAALAGPGALWVEWLVLPYLMACLAQGSIPLLARFARLGDPTLGMVLYGFPAQQALLHLRPDLGWAWSIAAATALALLAGYLSWHLVERPLLRPLPAGAPAAPDPGPIAMGPGRANNFDGLRLAAALLVLYGHGLFLAEGRVPGLLGAPMARLGLDIFFAVSGALVTASWLRDPSPGRYWLRRGRRILPGLACCTLVTMLVIGPLATRLPLAAYFSDPATWRYLATAALYPAMTLPGVFTASPHAPGVVNGSLWSLGPEVVCYLLVILTAGAALARALPLAALLGGIGLGLFARQSDAALYGVALRYALIEMPFFLVGATIVRAERRWPGLVRADVALLLLAAVFAVPPGIEPLPLHWVATPYVVLAFGRLDLPPVSLAARWGDLSYGTYLYAFPVQQLVLDRPGLAAHPLRWALPLTLAAALLSWHLIERRALGRGGKRDAVTPAGPLPPALLRPGP